jgi:membrane-associated protease RseP (regulator of RpoE activity)
VTPQDFSAAPYPVIPGNGTVASWSTARTRERWWLHGLLFAATLFTATVVGAGMQHDFARNLPFDIDHSLTAFQRFLRRPAFLLEGLPFSLTLLGILLAHELGHYFACLYYGLDASPPFFLPSPFLGTFGAFIKIRNAIYLKRVLFDVGIAGPLAGFAVLLPALAIGLAFSKVIPGINSQSSVQFGTPALEWLLQRAIFPGVPAGDIYLHPVARGAWIGVFATALNLLPIGQLDGGHILYSLVGDRHRLFSKIFIVALIPLGPFFWWGWLFWAVVLFLIARKHPVIYDSSELGTSRTRLGWLAMAVFLLCFTLAPFRVGGM